MIKFKIFPDIKVVYVRYPRVVNSREIISGFVEFTTHPQFRPDLINISDLSRIEKSSLNADEFQILQDLMIRNQAANNTPRTLTMFAPLPHQQTYVAQAKDQMRALPNVTFAICTSIEETMESAQVCDQRLRDLISGWSPLEE